MYERMLDKQIEPEQSAIRTWVGQFDRIAELEKQLQERYELNKELKYPFGNNYGWGYKYSHKSKHLCYLFFEKSAFNILIQIGTNEVEKLLLQLDGFLPKTREIWDNRYPCGKGGWLNYRILEQKEMGDILKLIEIKKKPVKFKI